MARLYALLARILLPRAFFEEYGDELRSAVAGRLERAQDGRRRAVLFVRELGDLIVTAARERWALLGDGAGARRRAAEHSARRGGSMLRDTSSDARYAVRRLATRPGYTLLAMLTLALGVGGTAAVYGIAASLLFDPLPYAHEREVGIFWKQTDWREEEFLHIRGRTPGFSLVALYRQRDMTLRVEDGPAQLLRGVVASAELFDVLGAPPLLGRGFRTGEDAPGAEPVAILSHGLWQEMGGDPSVVGRTLTIDGARTAVVGVMPRGFWFPDPSVRVWTPAPLSPSSQSWNSTLVGRVAPGQDVRSMAAPVARLAAMLGERFDYPPQWDKTRDAAITPLRDEIVGGMRPALLATLCAMALILLMACANVAALMLGQVDARQPEFALRLALGASRRRLARQIMVEAVLIGAAAGALGAVLAWAGFQVVARALPLGAWTDATAPDWTIFGSAMAIAVAAALLVAVVPMLSLRRGDLRAGLGSARTGGVAARGGRLESGLVVAEVALAVLIAAGAALLARSVANLYAVDPGIRAEGVGVVDVTLAGTEGRARQLQTLDELTSALASLPGVRAVAVTQVLPLRDGGYNMALDVEGRPELEGASTEYRVVTPGYLEIMGIRLRAGRTIAEADRAGTESVVVINEALARSYFPGEDPIGRRLGDRVRGRVSVVVGVVANAAENGLTDEARPVRYVPLAQLPWVDARQSLVIQATRAADLPALLHAAGDVVRQVAPHVAVLETTTLSRVLDVAVGPARQVMALLSLLTGLALALGAVGVYGVIAHFAARQRRDWAIRVVLGLPPSRLVAHVVRHGSRLVAAGILIGLLAAAALTRLLASLLYGVGTLDHLAFMAAGAALMAVGLLAASLPAIRAGTIDPGITLRQQ